MNKSRMKKGLALVLALVMVLATTASVFAADAKSNITVNVKLDTRSYSLSPALRDNNNNLLANDTQVTYSSIVIPAGSTVWDALTKIKNENNFNVTYKTVADYYDSSKTHYAVQDIAQVGENAIEATGAKYAFITKPTPTEPRGYYYESGWVYGLTPENGIEYFPGNYMDATEVTDGMTITLHFSTTGCYDINTNNWTPDYSNPDVTMWNLYDKVKNLDPTDSMGAIGYIDDEIQVGSSVEAGNTTGLTAYYFSHNGLTGDNQFIPFLEGVLEMLQE